MTIIVDILWPYIRVTMVLRHSVTLMYLFPYHNVKALCSVQGKQESNNTSCFFTASYSPFLIILIPIYYCKG